MKRSLSDFGRWAFQNRQHRQAIDTSGPSLLNSEGENRCLFQGFEWHVPADQKHWKRIEAALHSLKELGIDEIWLPPGCKATHPSSNGYDIYDLYDLGEFEQKWHRATKWGSIEDLRSLSTAAQNANIGLIWDVVLSHRAGGDHKEKTIATEVSAENRNRALSRPHEIEAWLGFDFDGRSGKYSNLKLHAGHFSGTDHDSSLQTQKPDVLYLTAKGKRWSPNVDTSEHGNYDYLMFSNLDYTSAALRADAINWGANFMPSTLSALSGYRIDAARHLDWEFTNLFLSETKKTHPEKKWTFIAEYWHGNAVNVLSYLRKFPPELGVMAYDAALLYSFHNAAKHLLPNNQTPAGRSSRPPPQPPVDLRQLLKSTLVSVVPNRAVTIVASHDTQPGQTMDCPIPAEFKEAAYAITLLRKQGLPSVFWGDLYGVQAADGHDAIPPLGKLPDLILTRRLYAYGTQREYWSSSTCIGWTRSGLPQPQVQLPNPKPWKSHGCAVIISNMQEGGNKKMCVGKVHAGETWTGLWEWETYKTDIDGEGYGVFEVGGVGVNVYLRDVATGRERFGRFDGGVYGRV